MIAEPWNTILFLALVPLLVQGLKIYRDKAGKPMSDVAIQAVAFVLSGAFVFLSGGFAGLGFPAFPAIGADIVASAGAVLAWAAQAVAVAGTAFGAIVALYEVIYKKLYGSVGLVA